MYSVIDNPRTAYRLLVRLKYAIQLDNGDIVYQHHDLDRINEICLMMNTAYLTGWYAAIDFEK